MGDSLIMTYQAETIPLNNSSKMEVSSSRPVQLWKKVVGVALLSSGLIYSGKNWAGDMLPSANVLRDHKAIDKDTAIKMVKEMVDKKIDEVGGIEEYQQLALNENKQYSHYDPKDVGEGVQVTYSSTSGPNENEDMAIFGARCGNLNTSLLGGVFSTRGCISFSGASGRVRLDVRVAGVSVWNIDLAIGGNTKFPFNITIPALGRVGVELEVQVFPNPKFAQICINAFFISPCTPKIYF